MSDYTVEVDAFGRTLEQLLGRVGAGVKESLPPVIERALDLGESEWKKNARRVLSKSYSRGGWGKVRPGAIRFKSGYHKGQVKSGWYGKVYRTGKYARSIRHRMITSGGDTPDGEIGSPSMPGLAHLLEKGHALMGGGSTRAFVHIEPAAEEAFSEFERLADHAVERAIHDA